MIYFRANRNKFEELDQCWLVGGGTHPGSGLPIILESARITANGILKQDQLPLHPVKPLPKIKQYQPTTQLYRHQPAAIKMNG